MFDLVFLGGAARLDEFGIGGDTVACLLHFHVHEAVDLVVEGSGTEVAFVIFLSERLDLVEQLSPLVVSDRPIDRGHDRLQIGEGLLGRVGRALFVAGEQLVGIQSNQHQLIHRLTREDHHVADTVLRGNRLQLLNVGAQLRTGRVEHVFDQL